MFGIMVNFLECVFCGYVLGVNVLICGVVIVEDV